MEDNQNNLNLVNYDNTEFSNIKLSHIKKEANKQIPSEQVINFLNNGINKIAEINQNMLSTNILKVYNITMEKTKEMIQGLSILIFEAFTKVNTNIDFINKKIVEIENNYNNIRNNCVDMWNK